MSKQSSIHSYFQSMKKDGTVLEVNRFFYLKWTNMKRPDYQAVWLSEAPSEINFIHEIRWSQVRPSHTFYLCGYFSDIQDKRFRIPQEKTYKNIPFMKSHLQKNVRKQNDNLAISSAYHLIKLSITDFLRRLPVIMVEDSYLHESFTTLIWLMIAESVDTFSIKKYMIEWLLGIVYVLTQMTKDVIIHTETSLIPQKQIIYFLDSIRDFELHQKSILYSLLLRASYGGMSFDVHMFQQFALIWKERFIQNPSIEHPILVHQMRIRPIQFFSILPLELDNWDLTAIDFHCSTILEMIHKKYPDMEINTIKQLIWFNYSSVNTRVEHTIYEPELWRQIKKTVDRTQKYLLDSNY
jgi:hypothetical protein